MKEKFSKLSRITLAMAAMLIMFGANKSEASAKIVQTDASVESVTFTWDESTSTQYYIGYSTDSNEGYKKAREMASAKTIPLPGTQKSYTISGLGAGTNVYVAVLYTETSRYGKVNEYNSTSTLKTHPGQVQGVNQEEWFRLNHSVNVEWTKQDAVNGYEYVVKNSKGKVVKKENIPYNSTGFTLRNIKNTMVYTCQVRAYSKIDLNGQEVVKYGDWSSTAYFMTQPAAKPYRGNDVRGLDVNVSGGKLTVKWEKVNGLSGYNVYVTDKKYGKFKKVKKSLKANTTKAVITKIGKKKIKNSKTYYVYVEGYKKVGGNTYTTGLNYISISGKGSDNVIYKSSWDQRK